MILFAIHSYVGTIMKIDNGNKVTAAMFITCLPYANALWALILAILLAMHYLDDS